MIEFGNINILSRFYIIPMWILLTITLLSKESYAQEQPPKPIQIFAMPGQGIIFGAFAQGSLGGTVTVSNSGARASTGDIVLLNIGPLYAPAIYEVEGNAGMVVSIMNGSSVSLSGSNGGSITLNIGTSDVGSPFVLNTQSPARMLVHIGGTLVIGPPASNPPGNYSGTYQVTFIQE